MQSFIMNKSRWSMGQSLIELALILPLLLILLFGIIDYARAIQFNNILVSMSREGANLASRTTETPRNIIRALTNSAEPLDMSTDGRIYITHIIGQKVVQTCVDSPPNYCATYPQVLAQTRAIGGSSNLPSRVWTCLAGWNNQGTCIAITGNNSAILPVALKFGEEVYAVETLYDYQVMVTYFMTTGPKLYSLTVL